MGQRVYTLVPFHWYWIKLISDGVRCGRWPYLRVRTLSVNIGNTSNGKKMRFWSKLEKKHTWTLKNLFFFDRSTNSRTISVSHMPIFDAGLRLDRVWPQKKFLKHQNWPCLQILMLIHASIRVWRRSNKFLPALFGR